MGRKFPIGKNPTIHPIISVSLLVACIAATIAIISYLCGSFSRKKPSSPDKNCNEITSQQNEVLETLDKPKVASNTVETDMSNESEKPEPSSPPPAPKLHSRASSYHFQSNATPSIGKLTSSVSMRLQGGMNALRQSSKRDKSYKHEDSIWKKQIILGEKCRIPDEEDDDDTILYDEKGNRISTYHPKTPAPISLSRQSSYVDPTATPS